MSEGRAMGEEAREEFTRRQVYLIFGGLLLAMLTAALNQTIVSTALPMIIGELDGLDPAVG